MIWFLRDLVVAFLLPPLNLIILGVVGIFFLRNRPVLGKSLIITTFILFYILSIPIVAENALKTLQVPVQSSFEINKVQAIVILGSGAYIRAPEYNDDYTVSQYGLERIRYGAYLQRHIGKPILVSGGDTFGIGSSEAEQMKLVLENEFHVPVKWSEGSSRDTRENAYNSFSILRKDNITHIALVTHAWHMRRAIREFEHAGFSVIPASTIYVTQRNKNLFSFIPSASAFQKNRIFLNEIIGTLWYQLFPASDKS
ncbi:MAG: hypothetical protein CMH70_03040 [Nitrosomonadaceae bacterium]|nr:hypothetical protein [Nitrosomonadaceae bacterium]|tara:strand:- start:1731 stop:2495 length:765 start_codon:yes stop_codon:yes gene_type:complete